MAVYKATYCYPLANSLDVRIVSDQNALAPCEWLKCQVDTSNKRVSGYQIKIFTKDNRQIFPYNNGVGKISPIDELNPSLLKIITSDEYLNTGLNGSMLNIPFFQNYNHSSDAKYDEMLLPSYNAIYYKPKYKTNYVVESLDDWSVLSTGNLINFGWDGVLNGEMVLKDETILCLSGDYEGIWQIQDNGTVKLYEDINGESVNIDKLKSCSVVITHGDQHETIYYFDGNGAYTISSNPAQKKSGFWVDVEGHSIDIDIDGSTYKWEVILYQGEGCEASPDTVSVNGYSTQVRKMDYSALNFEWFDTVLSSGTVLGSTNKRIQVASASDSSGIIPEGTATAPIVLQGKYVRLYSTADELLGSAYIQTYDATYGHIYPSSDSFTMDIINSAKYVRCFKYSNDPEYILPSDRVQVATTAVSGNLSLWLPSASSPSTDDEPNPNTGLPTIDGYHVKDGDLVLVKNQTNAWENGVYIAHPEGQEWTRSGSYRTWASFMGQVFYVEGGTINGGLNFQASAQTFGVIYNPPTGDAGTSPLYFLPEKPISLFPSKLLYTVDYIYTAASSAAITTATDLDGYKVDSSYIGQTYLHCYLHKIYKITGVSDTTVTVTELHNSSTSVVHINYGKTYAGSDILNKLTSPYYEESYAVSRGEILKNTSTKTFISPYIGLTPDMAIKLQNQKHVYYDYAPPYNSSLTYNVGDYVYSPSPSSGVYRCLEDNVTGTWDYTKWQYLSSFSRYCPTEWIRINTVNKTLWYIEHATLLSATGAATPMASISETDTSIPYTYDIRTYYRASDENPFYTYEMPYLKLGEESGGFTNIMLYEPYQVLEALSDENYEDFLTLVEEAFPNVQLLDAYQTLSSITAEGTVTITDSAIDGVDVDVGTTFLASGNGCFVCTVLSISTTPSFSATVNVESCVNGEYYYIFKGNTHAHKVYQYVTGSGLVEQSTADVYEDYLVTSSGLTAIAHRYIELQGFYHQWQHASWESYRWVLKNYNGEIIQDTGDKYDKLMKVWFYGLSNNLTNNSNRYTAELYVTDSIGNNLIFTVSLVVDPNSYTRTDIDFSAKFDCDTHSIILNYQDNVFIAPTVEFQNKDVGINSEYNLNYLEGTYMVSDGSAYITDRMKDSYYADVLPDSFDGISNYVPISNIYAAGYVMASQAANFSNYSLSDAVVQGSEFSHYYLTNQLISLGSSVDVMPLNEGEQILTVQDNSAYFETQVALGDNYCGEVCRYTMEGTLSDTHIALAVSTEETFVNGGLDETNINTDRNKFKVRIIRNDEEVNLTTISGSRGQSFYTIGENFRYLLQPANLVSLLNDGYEYYQFYNGNSIGDLFYIPVYDNVTNSYYFYNSTEQLGNCCLMDTPNDTNLTYWSEEWGTLMYYQGSLIVGSDTGINLLASSNVPSWPTESYETSYYWTEENGDKTKYPIKLSDIKNMQSGEALQQFHVIPRHPGLSLNDWRVIMRVTSIDALYDYTASNYVSFLNIQISTDEATGGDKFLLRYDSTVLAEIVIYRILEED